MSLVAADLSQFPTLPGITGGAATSSMLLDASTDVLCAICRVPVTGTISHVHYRVTGSSTPNLTLRVELRTVNLTTGIYDAAGSLYGSSTSITSVNPTTGNKTAAVNATAATKGDLIAIVLDFSAFTSGSISIADRVGDYGFLDSSARHGFAYGVRNNAASDVKGAPVQGLQLEYGGTFYPISPHAMTATRNTAAVTNSGTTRRGNKFTPAVPRRACGIWAMMDNDGACVLRLRLASDDSILATATPDPDVRGNTGQAYQFYFFDSGTTVNLAAGTAYYVLAEGTDATGVTVTYLENIPANANLGAMPGGINYFGVTYAGSYTEANTTRYDMGLLTDMEDNGVSGGGLRLAGHGGLAA